MRVQIASIEPTASIWRRLEIETQEVKNKGLTTDGQTPSNIGPGEVIVGLIFAPKSPPRIPPGLQPLLDRWEALAQGIRAQ